MMNRARLSTSIWVKGAALTAVMSIGGYLWAIPDCDGNVPGAAANCSTESKCEDLAFVDCDTKTGWYFQDQGSTTCPPAVPANPNEACVDSTTLIVKCVCKWNCQTPDPYTEFCEKGSPVLVDDGTGNMVPQCSTMKVKVAPPLCDLT